MVNLRKENYGKRYYIDGKCVLSYDDDVFSNDDDYTNIKELFIYPAVDKVYVKYYEKQLVQQVLEKTLKKNDSIFNTYCAIKELIKDEPISVDYVQSEEDTLLKNLMRKNLNSDEYVEFEKLLDEAGINAWREQVDFLGRGDGMIEHIWCEYGIDKRRFSV